jgi:hypothetical protein
MTKKKAKKAKRDKVQKLDRLKSVYAANVAEHGGVHSWITRNRDQQTAVKDHGHRYQKSSRGTFMVELPASCCFGKPVAVSVRNSEYTSTHFAAFVANGMLLRIESHFYDQGAAPDWSYSDVDTHTSKLFSAEEMDALKKRAEAEVEAMWGSIKIKLEENKQNKEEKELAKKLRKPEKQQQQQAKKQPRSKPTGVGPKQKRKRARKAGSRRDLKEKKQIEAALSLCF